MLSVTHGAPGKVPGWIRCRGVWRQDGGSPGLPEAREVLVLLPASSALVKAVVVLSTGSRQVAPA